MALSLPSEILQLVSERIDTISTHLAFSQTCASVRGVYNEGFWKTVLYRLGYGRALNHKTVQWGTLAAMITGHITACVVCKEVDAEHSYLRDDNAIQVLSKEQVRHSEELDIMKGIKEKLTAKGLGIPPHDADEESDEVNLPNSHLIAYYFFHFPPEERPHLDINTAMKLQAIFEQKTGKKMKNAEFKRAGLLSSHIVISSLLATTIPVSTLSLEVQEPENYHMYDDDDDDYATGFGCQLSPKTLTNRDGITVLDLFRAGANWNKRPGGMMPSTAFFGIGLDIKTSTATFFYEDAEMMSEFY